MILHYYGNWEHWKLDVSDPADIEEAIMRCGWTILNDAESVTAEDRAIITDLESRPYIESRYPNGQGREWWDAHAGLVETGILTPDV
jgi:hypothetical protein